MNDDDDGCDDHDDDAGDQPLPRNPLSLLGIMMNLFYGILSFGMPREAFQGGFYRNLESGSFTRRSLN